MSRLLFVLTTTIALTLVSAQYQQTTPVPILKQINRHNEDGSYSYGYEAADGSYKIESKYPTGEVFGKYGFVDDTGNLREVEYGASRRGFEPAGTGINVPPPTINNAISGAQAEDDGQYREDPSIYYTDPKYTNGERYEPVPRPHAAPIYDPAVPATGYSQPQAQAQPQPQPQLPIYQTRTSGIAAEYRPAYRTQYPLSSKVSVSRNAFQGHPVPSASGSYTVNYRR